MTEFPKWLDIAITVGAVITVAVVAYLMIKASMGPPPCGSCGAI
jgi:hypothetical protein